MFFVLSDKMSDNTSESVSAKLGSKARSEVRSNPITFSLIGLFGFLLALAAIIWLIIIEIRYVSKSRIDGLEVRIAELEQGGGNGSLNTRITTLESDYNDLNTRVTSIETYALSNTLQLIGSNTTTENADPMKNIIYILSPSSSSNLTLNFNAHSSYVIGRVIHIRNTRSYPVTVVFNGIVDDGAFNVINPNSYVSYIFTATNVITTLQ